jgi:hypothetical protein
MTVSENDNDVMVQLDDNVLERLAGLICGDDSTPHYRSGYQLTRFFEAAGWRRVGEIDGARFHWVQDMLRRRRRDPEALRGVLIRLADPREYLDAEENRALVVQELNDLLAIEGYQITYRAGRPVVVAQTPTMKRPVMQAPVKLTASLAEIVSDEAFGQQLQSRLDEAHACWKNGACTAAVIMLGSVLEGVLYDVAVSRHDGGKAPSDHLESLINLAADKRWVAQDVVDYAHVLRNHRNLVHPKKQFTQGYAPEDDTVRIAWNVVVAALNDLAAPTVNQTRKE